MNTDKQLFRRTKFASWSVRISSYGIDDTYAVYGHHHRCPYTEKIKASWSWFLEDPAECYNCKTKVPDYIQALVRLYLYR